jgi:hypothetical protein
MFHPFYSHPQERNATYTEVLRGLASSFLGARGGPYAAPLAHDLCVWLGDLNYRIDAPKEAMSKEELNREVRRLIGEGEWLQLLRSDQLKQAQQSGAAFTVFTEAPLAFQPTYKYDAGTNVYDTSEKQRIPSWTDRVLWKGGGVESLACAVFRP